MTPRPNPSHTLDTVQEAVRQGAFQISKTAVDTAGEVLCDREDIRECVLNLTRDDFYKTMESKDRPGLWQDVYKTHHYSFPVYVKLQMTARGTAYVISFKLDEDP